MASNHDFLELEPPAERLRHVPNVLIVGGGFAGVHASAVADLHGFKFSGRLGLLLWAIVHLALIPDPQPREPNHLEHQMAVRPSAPARDLDSVNRNAEPASGA